MTIKVPCGTIVVPYSGQKPGKVYWDQSPQHPGNLPYFVLMWRMKYRIWDPLIVIHVDEDKQNVIIEKYNNSELISRYKAPRTEIHQLHTKYTQFYLSTKLDAISADQKSYLIPLQKALRRIATQKYLAANKNINNHGRAKKEELERHERLRRLDFSPFTFEPLPENPPIQSKLPYEK